MNQVSGAGKACYEFTVIISLISSVSTVNPSVSFSLERVLPTPMTIS